MRILVVLHKAKKIGGMVLQFLKMAKQFELQGHEVLIFSFDNYSQTRNIFFDILNIYKELKKQINEFKPDIIFASDPYITASIAILAKPKSIPIVLRIGTILHLFYASRIIEEISPENIFNPFFNFIAFLLKGGAKIIFKKIDLIVFNSFFLQNTFFKNAQNSIVIHNGVDILARNEPKTNSIIKLVYVGRIHPRKSIELLIHTLNILKREKINFHFSIIGKTIHNIKYWEKLSKLISKYQLWDFITAHGQITNEKLPDLLVNHDILLFSTDDRNYPITEGLPNVILEGMANGLAIVSTNAGGVPEILFPKNGFIVEPKAEKFAEKIIYLAKNQAELLKMRKANLKTISQNNNIEITSKLYLDAFKEIKKRNNS